MATANGLEQPLFALRGNRTTALYNRSKQEVRDFKCQSRVFTFSPDGSLFAFSNSEGVKVYATANSENFELQFEVNRPNTTALRFSPCSTTLALWENCRGTQSPSAPPDPNLQLWNCKTKIKLCDLLQKKQLDWCPQWSGDEAVCARNVNNEILFYESNNFSSVCQKLHLPKVASFRIAETTSAPYAVAVHVPGSKGQPSSVRLFHYPNFGDGAAIASKSFFKAEKVELVWNKRGTALVILTSTESSESSYYGEQGLHYIDVKGESCLVPRAKEGPIYNVAWNPDSKSFCVVYGYMPAKATLYNLKCEPTFDFGTGPRNCVYYNPHGNMLCLAGFGNLRGNMEFWDIVEKRKVSNPQAVDSTYFEWCPDGEHFLTATTTPRLRVDNCFKVWHYAKPEPLEFQAEGELYEVLWRPVPLGVYPQPIISAAPAASSAAKSAAPKPATYVPPQLRNRPQSEISNRSRYQEDYELPSNLKQVEQKGPSKSSIKNKKKREAKARKKLEQGPQDQNDKDSDEN